MSLSLSLRDHLHQVPFFRISFVRFVLELKSQIRDLWAADLSRPHQIGSECISSSSIGKTSEDFLSLAQVNRSGGQVSESGPPLGQRPHCIHLFQTQLSAHHHQVVILIFFHCVPLGVVELYSTTETKSLAENLLDLFAKRFRVMKNS